MVHMRIAVTGMAISLLAAPALAQAPAAARPAAPPQPVTTVGTVLSNAEVIAAGAAARAAGQPGAPQVMANLFNQPPFRVAVEHRIADATASTHANDAELFSVIDGEGTVVMGGELVRPPTGGMATISGGTSKRIFKGDLVFVPSGVPHAFVDVKNLTLMGIHLPLPK